MNTKILVTLSGEHSRIVNNLLGPVTVHYREVLLYWLFKIFEIQKGRTFSFNDILRLCTIVVNIAIRIRA